MIAPRPNASNRGRPLPFALRTVIADARRGGKTLQEVARDAQVSYRTAWKYARHVPRDA